MSTFKRFKCENAVHLSPVSKEELFVGMNVCTFLNKYIIANVENDGFSVRSVQYDFVYPKDGFEALAYYQKYNEACEE